MGVEYFPCASCRTTICDGGDYDKCSSCGAGFCRGCRAKNIGLIHSEQDEDGECFECICCTANYSVKKISKSELIQFLLEGSPYKTVAEVEAALRARHTAQ